VVAGQPEFGLPLFVTDELLTGADDEELLRGPRLPDSKAREYCLARQYSGLGNDALPVDCKFPRRPMGPWLR
jgi:hypothetical protein